MGLKNILSLHPCFGRGLTLYQEDSYPMQSIILKKPAETGYSAKLITNI